MKLDFFTSIDSNILHFINVDLQNPIMDQFWLIVTQLHKIPLVKFAVLPALLLWMAFIYKREVWKPLLVLAVAVAASDTIAYRVIKKSVERPRPTQNEMIQDWLRPVGQGHGSSFPSNHTSNCFAGAVVLSYFFRRSRWAVYGLATLVGISRAALGVHYPSDVLAGAILGLIVGHLVVFVTNRLNLLKIKQPQFS